MSYCQHRLLESTEEGIFFQEEGRSGGRSLTKRTRYRLGYWEQPSQPIFTIRVLHPHEADKVAKSVDPHQRQSDLDLLCFPKHICPICPNPQPLKTCEFLPYLRRRVRNPVTAKLISAFVFAVQKPSMFRSARLLLRLISTFVFLLHS